MPGGLSWPRLLPRLVGFLSLPPSEANVSDTQECFYRSLVDALIRLDAQIPGDALSRLYRRYPDESVILFSKSKEDNQASLLALFQEKMPTLRWQAIGNLLAEKRSLGFVELLMRQMQEINVTISVTDSFANGGCGGSAGYGVIDRTVPEGFPPVGLYALTDQPEHTAGVVAHLPHPIYYRRWTFEPGDQFRVESPFLTWNSHFGDGRDHFRFEYLAMLLQARLEDVEFDAKPAREINWVGPADYQREVVSICTQVLDRYDALVTRLAAFGLLTPAETGNLNARVHLRIIDLREDKGIPLPETSMDRVVVER